MPAADSEGQLPALDLEAQSAEGPRSWPHDRPRPQPPLSVGHLASLRAPSTLGTCLASVEFFAEGALVAAVAFGGPPGVPAALPVLPWLLSIARLALHLVASAPAAALAPAPPGPSLAPLLSLVLATAHGCSAVLWGLALWPAGALGCFSSQAVLFLGCFSVANAVLLAVELDGGKGSSGMSSAVSPAGRAERGRLERGRAHGSDRLADLSLEREMVARARRPRGEPLPDCRFGSTCVICLEECETGRSAARLPCGHTFHSDCLHDWLLAATAQPRCPTCNWQPPSPPSKAQVRAAIASAALADQRTSPAMSMFGLLGVVVVVGSLQPAA